jgi:hypothetical protein
MRSLPPHATDWPVCPRRRRDALTLITDRLSSQRLIGQHLEGPDRAVAWLGGVQACLLPPFDEYLLGYKDRSTVLDPAFSKRVNRGGGILKPTMILDGEVIAIWSRDENKGELEIEIEAFRNLESEEKAALELAAARMGRFLTVPLGVIRWDVRG